MKVFKYTEAQQLSQPPSNAISRDLSADSNVSGSHNLSGIY